MTANPRPIAEPAGAKPATRPARLPSAPPTMRRGAPSRNTARGPAIGLSSGAAPKQASATTQLSFIIDGDASIRHFLSLLLHGAGIDTEEFADGDTLAGALGSARADLVFINIGSNRPPPSSASSRSASRSYRGSIQLMSNRGAAVLDPCQEPRPAAQPAHAAGAQEAVRDRRHRQNSPGSQARPAAALAAASISAKRSQEMDRILVPAEDRSAQKTARRRRGLRPRAPSRSTACCRPSAFMPGASDASLIALVGTRARRGA